MKKRNRWLAVVLLLALTLSLTACGASQTDAASKAQMDTASVDVDLTAMSGTMVYAEVYQMLMTPEDYIGKTVKMSGQCTWFYDDMTETDYYTCIVQDATACCASGIEFVLADGASYPEENEEITVVGVFDTYTEGEYMYCTLRDAALV